MRYFLPSMHCVRLGEVLLSLLGLSFILLSCGGSQPVHGMYPLAFPSASVCFSQEQTISFKNTSSDEIVMTGVMKTLGTDPLGNFTLKSVRVGTQETNSTQGFLQNIHVPPGVTYTFVVDYTPQTQNATHTSTIDIVYEAPTEGVVQVALTGRSTANTVNCLITNSPTPGVGTLDGDMTITIDRIVLINSQLPQAITTDRDQTVRDYQPATLPIHLSAQGNTVTLRAIPATARFILPPSRGGGLSTVITGDTLVTSQADVTGTYSDDGNLTLPNAPIHLKEAFETDFVVTLSTGAVDPGLFRGRGLLRSAGFAITSDGQISGSPINAQNETTLVGFGSFTNGQGTGQVADQITSSDVKAVVMIKAHITPPAR